MPDIRLIIDENISWRLKKSLPDWTILPSNEIQKDKRLSDFKIWQFANINDYHVLTFDEDFTELHNAGISAENNLVKNRQPFYNRNSC